MQNQTRRVHSYEWKLGCVYGVRDRLFGKPVAHILVLRKFRQRLGDLSAEDVGKEGYSSLQEFQRAWKEVHGQGSWNPNLLVPVSSIWSKSGRCKV